MKIIVLSVIICSALYGNCKEPYTKNIEYNSWAEFMYAGNNDTLALYNIMGEDYINANKIYVKFMCAEQLKEEEKI